MSASPSVIERVGGVLVRPRPTLLAICHGRGGGLALGVTAYLVVQLLVFSRGATKAALLFPEAPGPAARRFFGDQVWRLGSLHVDAVVFAAAAAAFVLFARWVSPHRVHPRQALAALGTLLVPTLVLVALGGGLAKLGVDLWPLPHRAVDFRPALTVVDDAGRVSISWVRFYVKIGVAYGWPAVLLADLTRQLWRPPAADEAPPPRPQAKVLARAGAALALGSVLFVLVAAGVDGVRRHAQLRPTLPGDPLPEVALPWLGGDGPGRVGSRFKPSEYRGKVLVVDFWASWCPPCVRAIPELSEIAREYGEEVQVVGVNREPRDKKAALAAMERLDFAFPSALDRRARTRSGFGEQLGLQSLPTTFIVDKSGVVRHLHLGYTEPARLRAELDALLAPAPGGDR